MRHVWPLILLLAGAAAFGADTKDDPVTVTTFTLKDGTKLQGTSFSSLGDKDMKSYLVVTLDGKRQIFLEKELASRAEEIVPLDKLTPLARAQVLKLRADAEIARAESEAQEKEQRAVAVQRKKEYGLRAGLAKTLDELALAKTVLSNAEAIVKNAPVEIARLDAQYDAAKTELAGNRDYVATYVGGVRSDSRRSDYLRDQMVSAAEDKAKIEQTKKEAQDVVTRMNDTIKTLEARAAAQKKDLDTAEVDTKAALLQAREAAKERADERIKQVEKEKIEKAEKPAPPPAKPAPENDPGLEIRPADKAVVAPPAVPAPPAAPKEPHLILTLKDGAKVRASMMLVDPDGRVTVKDDAGKVHYYDAGEISKQELEK